MGVVKFIAASIALAFAYDSLMSYVYVINQQPEMAGSLAIIFAMKLVAAMSVVGFAVWARSTWRGRHG